MQHMKTVQYPATTKEIVDHTTCDFCGTKLPQHDYDFEEVTLEYHRGTGCQDGGYSVKTSFDCCGDCWAAKVLPALRALGAEPRTEGSDW